MKTPSATPQPTPQAKAAKPSLADQIAASKAQGGKAPAKPAAPAPSAAKPNAANVTEVRSEPSKTAEARAALVRELTELWKDRTSRIVLLCTAGTIALGIVGGAALYSRKPDEPKKKPEVPASVEKESEKREDPMTPQERYALHRSIVAGVPYELPKKDETKTDAPVSRHEEEIQEKRAVGEPKSDVPDSEKLRAKREEIATTGQLKVSTNPEDMKATMDALKEWSRQDAESARVKAAKR